MASKPTYRVKEWEKHFECASTRKITGALKWVPVPTKHDGATFRRLMRRDDGLSIYGCWVLILQVAGKCRQRGTLIGDHGPIDADHLELMTDVPAATFQTAFEVLSSVEIGWLETVEQTRRHNPPLSATVVADRGAHNPRPAATVADSGAGDPSPAAIRRAGGVAGVGGVNPSPAAAVADFGLTDPGPATIAAYRKEGIQEGIQVLENGVALSDGIASTSIDGSPSAVTQPMQDEFSHLPESKAVLARALKRGRELAERDDKATSIADHVASRLGVPDVQ